MVPKHGKHPSHHRKSFETGVCACVCVSVCVDNDGGGAKADGKNTALPG